MKKIKNKIILLVMMLGLKIISFSYEDYYEKVYTIKVSKEELYKEINATLKQKKRLEKIFETYQKKAEKIENRLIKFENKKIELGKIEFKRYEEISKVLSENQLQSFNIFINSQKLAFEQKNDKIKNLIDNLNLTNEQKSEILRYERNFQRYINNIEISSLPTEKYITEYEKAKNIRNEKMRSILTIEQLKIIEE
ncbi:MAG: viral A-type inclusion protein [Leptotrichiaceae bacterium]|nr:viral A-type inclusion protein [Leptotrichiaceae bacterium]MBP7725707.1 viral A-type inclusion protein [Leptotrichiaceae bacterium]